MRDKITSVKNEHIKGVIRLRDRRERDKTGLTIVEGAREIARAIEAKCDFKEFYICESFLRPEDQAVLKTMNFLKAPIYDTSKDVFEKIAYGERAEGILGVCHPKKYSLKDLSDRKDLFLFSSPCDGTNRALSCV